MQTGGLSDIIPSNLISVKSTPQTFALDVYGTLINTSGVLSTLQSLFGNQASLFSNTWRNKQLEYSFRRGLMNRYVDFSIVTKEALEYTCMSLQMPLTVDAQTELMNQYKTLPAFDDAKAGVLSLKEAGHRVFAFSNGSKHAVIGLLQHSDMIQYVDGVVSMETIQTFKPNPAGYAHFNQSSQSTPSDSWLVSGNPFDVIGAASYGMNSVWLNRSGKGTFDPMGFEPSVIISSLVDLSEAIANA